MTRRRILIWVFGLVTVAASVSRATADDSADKQPPKIGDTIPDFEFHTFDGRSLKLADVAAKGPVVLVVLRGYPGYQCPACTAQVADLRKHAEEMKKLGAAVILVYPGKAEKLAEHAKEFLKDSKLPAPLVLVTDPDFKFITAHNLRWDKAGETSYPSTFVLDSKRVVHSSKISHSHGDRAKAEEDLAVLRAMRAARATGQEIPNSVPKRPTPRR